MQHGLGVERKVEPADLPVQQRRTHSMVEQDIAIAARSGGKARMKTLWHLLCPANRDRVGQVAVGTQHPAALAAWGASVEVHHLTAAMYTGVGATGADHFDRVIGDLSQGLLQDLLHRWRLRLDLPAVVVGAVVFDAQGDSLKGVHGS